MKKLNGILKYLKYLFRHKYYVGKMCFKMGLYRQGIVHDLSKFGPSEFMPYMNYYTLWDKSYQYEMYKARNHHQKYNKHHRQYRVLTEDSGKVKPLEIPRKYAMEMLCDWRGTGRVFSKTPEQLERYNLNPRSEVYDWYYVNKDKMILHEQTRIEIEQFLEMELVDPDTAPDFADDLFDTIKH